MGGLDGLGGRIGGQETTSGDWDGLSGRFSSRCQGEGRGFESRRPLQLLSQLNPRIRVCGRTRCPRLVAPAMPIGCSTNLAGAVVGHFRLLGSGIGDVTCGVLRHADQHRTFDPAPILGEWAASVERASRRWRQRTRRLAVERRFSVAWLVQLGDCGDEGAGVRMQRMVEHRCHGPVFNDAAEVHDCHVVVCVVEPLRDRG